MRRNLLALLLATALLATPLALAGGDGPHEKARERSQAALTHSGGHDDENETDDDNDTRRGHGKGGNATAARPAWVSAFQDALRTLRASWAEDRAAIHEECRAQKPDENATREEQRAWAHCVRDGYKLWFDTLRAELKEIKAEARAAREA